MKFKVGDRVRIVRGKNYSMPEVDYSVVIGEVATIVRAGSRLDWTLDIQSPGGAGLLEALERCLEPIYDGDQAASWEDCVWCPEDLKVTIEAQ